VLVAAAQPMQTEDAWWHLALGRAYASHGPWLDADPLLHTAAAPPAPAAWLADLALYGLARAGGLSSLRLAHAAVVAAILSAAWLALRRASGSRRAASLATAAFAALSAYRLYQLRPDLLTIGATLLLYRLLLAEPRPPSRRQVLLATLLLGLWANLHSAFLIGPILLAAAIAGLCAAAALGSREERAPLVARARRLGLALALGLAATLVNPAGPAQHLAYFHAGVESPDLAIVVDEWAPLDLFHLPVPNLPPSLLAWAITWLLLASCAAIVPAGLRRRWRSAPDAPPDPALAAVAVASLVAMLAAVRFLWLGLFPLLLLAQWSAPRLASPRAPRRILGTAAALASLALALAFVRWGDWPMIGGGLRPSLGSYARAFPPEKYHAHAVWMLADAGLEGRLYNDYFMGGFVGFWLAPRLRAFVNGTLNLPREQLKAWAALSKHRGERPGESFAELLDREQVDVFLGVRTPEVPRSSRPRIYTTAHLERTPGWIPIFRTPREGVWLRLDARNRPNLERVAAYYAREGVPFDRERGFDPAAVIREAPEWAEAHGLVPRDLAALEAARAGSDPARKLGALERLAEQRAALGLYEEAVAIEREILGANPGAIPPARRLVWSLLRLGRFAEARAEARTLERAGGLPAAIARTARTAEDADPEARETALARLPVFTRPEARGAVAGLADPPPRCWPEADREVSARRASPREPEPRTPASPTAGS